MTLDTAFETHELPIDGTFTIARGSSETAAAVVVRIDDGDHEGLGAAAPSAYYGESAATAAAVLPELLAAVEDVGDPHATQRIERRLDGVIGGNAAAKSAVLIALADLAGKRLDAPLYRLWGLDPAVVPPTSYTIGSAEPDRMAERARERAADGFDVLKLKVGRDPGTDRRRVAAVREAAPAATIRVDANGGWSPRTAVAATEWLAEQGVQFLEQPVPGDDLAGLATVHERGAVPVAADESCVTPRDVPRLADRCDVIVVKLPKCGGPAAARRQAETAAAHGLETMLGCMVAPAPAIAPAVHLAARFDYADLDGSLLLADDPFDGVPIRDGRHDLSTVDRPGSGARER